MAVEYFFKYYLSTKCNSLQCFKLHLFYFYFYFIKRYQSAQLSGLLVNVNSCAVRRYRFVQVLDSVISLHFYAALGDKYRDACIHHCKDL